MIEHRSRQGEVDPDEREELWQESVRRYKAGRREAMRAAWCEYHLSSAARLRATLEALISHHETEAKLLEGGGGGQEI
jgi:hypothetical protein